MNGSNDISSIISKLTENPEMMKSLMGAANNLMNGGNDPPQKEEREHTHNKDSDMCEKDRGAEHHRKNRGNDAENLIRLLCALKPYVSHDRCEKIDGIVKILKLIQLSEKTGLLKSLI